MAKTHSKRLSSGTSNQLRIIGGKWRGRKLQFPTADGLRPTPDRVRETLFNWLAADICGAHCLDLFAGSGALGLEALSRGAASVDLIDNNRETLRQLKKNLQTLNSDNGSATLDNGISWLQQFQPERDKSYDIIFLDPPFHQGLAQDCINTIAQQAALSAASWVYLEMARDETLPATPKHWHLHREKTAGQVCYRLFSIENR